MTDITKEELHKLIDGADQNLLDKENCYRYNINGSKTYYSQAWVLKDLLMDCQKPKELTLHEKLINEGFVMREPTCSYHYYINTKTQIKVTPYEEFISVETLANKINIFDIDNHSKVLEVIEFLTNFQKKEDD
jgi:hypothetical protein